MAIVYDKQKYQKRLAVIKDKAIKLQVELPMRYTEELTELHSLIEKIEVKLLKDDKLYSVQ